MNLYMNKTTKPFFMKYNFLVLTYESLLKTQKILRFPSR